MEPLSALELLRLHLQQPEYLHVVLNPLLVYGLLLGVLALAGAWVARSVAAQRLALCLLAASALCVWPVEHYGALAYNNILMLADEDGRAWLEAHRDRGATVLPVFYLTALLASLALLLPLRWPQTRVPFTALALLVALLALGAGGWLGYMGGKIRHKEFRYGPPPSAAAEAAKGQRSPR